MTKSANDKKQRLVTAAATLFHRRGLATTSLVEVAREAGVAPGNVYYYFRTKDDLVVAVANHWRDRVDAMLAELDGGPDPWTRLLDYVRRADDRRANYVEHGCPLAGLNRELRQMGGDHSAVAAPAFERQIEWLAQQFIAGGLSARAATRDARFLLSSLQGGFSLGHAAEDDGPIRDVATGLSHWLGAVRAAA